MQPIRICHITSVHSPFDVRIFYKEAKSLLKEGYDVMLIAQHDKDETIDGIKLIALPKTAKRLYRMSILTMRTLWLAIKQNVAIYHIHDPELIPVSLLLKLISRRKIIYDVHEDYGKQMLSKSYLSNRAGKIMSYLIKKIEQYSSYYFDGIVTATNDISNNYSSLKRVISVKNFPTMSIFDEVIQGIDKNNYAFNIIYAGGISDSRGINEMVRSLEYVNNYNVRLTLCGRFSSGELERSVSKLRGFDKVKYLGWVEHDRMVALISSHDAGIVCLHPIANYITALPTKLFEYMASGLPVIASNFPLWIEIVEGNKCGICVDPLKPEEIARAIKYLMENPDEAHNMGENGRKAVLEVYNWEKESDKLLNLYRKVLG